ncbi:MAG TPA: hypothetical protein VKQ34_01535 [Candidatus Saccharimonadales bacterium]|nr:hypothetical protein [Candidatus Saccharimonadales bacterium]
MVEGTGRSARIRDQARPRLDIDFRMNLRMCFGQGYNSVAAGNPWVGRADLQYRQAAAQLSILRERHAPNPSLRSATSGGALGDTVTQLNILAGKLRRKQYNDTLAPGSPEDVWRAFCMRRIETMHDLAYLGLGRAGLNIEYVAALFSPGLGLLSGTLQTYDRPEGGTLTVFKRDSKKTWETVFPSPTAPDALGPTYKCPFHQSGPKEDGPSPLADFLPAAINLLGEQPRHLLNGDELRLLRYPAP